MITSRQFLQLLYYTLHYTDSCFESGVEERSMSVLNRLNSAHHNKHYFISLKSNICIVYILPLQMSVCGLSTMEFHCQLRAWALGSAFSCLIEIDTNHGFQL